MKRPMEWNMPAPPCRRYERGKVRAKDYDGNIIGVRALPTVGKMRVIEVEPQNEENAQGGTAGLCEAGYR